MSEPASKYSDNMSSDDPGRVSVPVAECYTRFDSIRIHWQQRQQSLESGEVARIHDSILIGFFENQVLPGLHVNFSTHTSSLREAEPWLSDFFRSTGGFTNSLALYTKEPMKMATKLNDYIELVYCFTVQTIYGHMTPAFPTLERVDDELKKIRKTSVTLFIRALDLVNTDPHWASTHNRVRQFAEVVGYQKSSDDNAERDVFTYINYLLGKAFKSTQSQQIAALEAKIAILTQEKEEYIEQSRTQNRIVANLTIRHILERLPPRSSKHEKTNWDDFWKRAVDEAIGKVDTPLSKLVESYALQNEKNPKAPPNVESIKKTGGAALYGALSTKIHHFKGEYKWQKDQWHILEWDILKAITPLTENI